MGEIGFGQDFVTLLSFLHLWNIAAAGVLVTDKKVGSIGDYSSSSDLSGACSTDSDDVPRSRAENCLVLPIHLFSTLTLIFARPYHHIVNVWQSVPCTVWQQVSPAWPSIRLSRNGLAVGTHAQPSWAPARPGCSMDQPVRPLLQKVRHCMKKWKMYLLIFLITGSPWHHQLTSL